MGFLIMLNLIVQTVTEALPDRKIEFKRNEEKSAEFSPVFDVVVNDAPVILFNSAIINKLDKTLGETISAIINGLIAAINTKTLPLPTP